MGDSKILNTKGRAQTAQLLKAEGYPDHARQRFDKLSGELDRLLKLADKLGVFMDIVILYPGNHETGGACSVVTNHSDPQALEYGCRILGQRLDATQGKTQDATANNAN